MKKGIATLLAVVMMLSIFVLPVSMAAAEEAGDGYGVTHVYYGDINYDRTIDAADALMALKNAVGKLTLDEVQQVVADVNVSTAIDAADALQILQFSVGKLTSFAAGEVYQLATEPADPYEGTVASFDKSNVVNNAYGQDDTADCSYVSDVSSLQPYTIYQVGATALKDLDNVRLAVSLQGIINRDFGMDENHSSLLFLLKDTSDSSWLSYVTEEGSIMYVPEDTDTSWMKIVRINTWEEFYATFQKVIQACGIILWDGNVPATANVAATICGLDGYLPVLAQSPLHNTLLVDGISVKQSLVGLFADGHKGEKITGTDIASTGSAKNDAYLWALEKYFARCSSTYLAYTIDGAITVKGYDAYEDNPIAVKGGSCCLYNHDYLIARRCFFYDLYPYKGEAACDDPAQKNGQADIGTDNATMLKIFAARYARANGAFGQLMGFPPWWAKYSSDMGQGSKAATWVEWLFCEYITCYNLAKEADAAQPAEMTNGSVFYKYIPKKTEYKNNKTKEANVTFDEDTYYYTIYVGDYDSSAWLKQHIHAMWMKNGGDRRRGKIALMWSINPNLSYRVPMIFDYMYENLSDMDYMAGGDGGAGYIIPEALFHDKALDYMGEKRPVENADAGQIWADYCKPFYERFDMDVTGFIINGNQYTFTKNMASSVSQYSPVINFSNCFNTRVGKYNGTYYVYCQNGIGAYSDGTMSAMYNHYQTTKNAGYNFSAYRTVCMTPTDIYKNVSNFESYAAGKGLTVKYCDPYTLRDILAKSGQGAIIQ